MFVRVVATLALLYFSTFAYCFVRNYLNARKSGFPSIIVPIDQNHVLWMILSVPLRPWLQKYLPGFIYKRLALTIYCWEYLEGLRPFRELAARGKDDKSFMLVTCGRAEFSTRDPELVNEILYRTRDFHQLDLTELFVSRVLWLGFATTDSQYRWPSSAITCLQATVTLGLDSEKSWPA